MNDKRFKLIQGDCLEIMPKLADDGVKVDLVLTDVPYGTTSCKWDSIISLDKMWYCLNNLINDDTPIVLFGAEPFSSNLRMSNIKNYRYDWIWYKNNASGFLFAKKQPLRNHENISVFYKKQPLYNPIKEDRDGTKESLKRNKYGYVGGMKSEIYDIVNVPHKVDEKSYPKTIKRFNNIASCKRVHPTQKPVELLEYLIKTYTNEDDLVLDFTMGSGSTGVACLQTNRNFIGIELEPKYYEIAKTRIKEANEQKKLI